METKINSHPEDCDDSSKQIGVQIVILGVLLAVFTLLSNYTATQMNTANAQACAQWAQYRILGYQMGMKISLIKVMAPDSIERANMMAENNEDLPKLKRKLDEAGRQGDMEIKKEKAAHQKAIFFDMSEAMLEITIVLNALYFCNRKRLFTKIGLLMGIVGVLLGLLGLI